MLVIFCLPETSPRQTVITVGLEKPRSDSEKTRTELPHPPTTTTTTTRINIEIIRDILHALAHLRLPAVTVTVHIASITFSVLGLLNISHQTTFSHFPYSLTPTAEGCLYIPIGVGSLIGCIYGGRWSDSIIAREAKEGGTVPCRG